MGQRSFATQGRLSLVLASIAFTTAAQAAPLVMEDFQLATTEGIVKLCTAPQSDPLYQGAIGYCVGYLTGAFHYYRAMEGMGATPKLVCFQSAEPSRREQIDNFVEWAKARPQYANDLVIDSMFRYLGETHPCPAPAGSKG